MTYEPTFMIAPLERMVIAKVQLLPARRAA
jgi:hypothetical protein